MRGTIAKLVKDRGFGFIRVDGDRSRGDKDIFFHRSNLIPREAFDALEDGQRVVFEAVMNERGWEAKQVRAPAVAPRSREG